MITNKKIRAVAILIKDEKVLLIHRKNERGEYYVFPGGKKEENETVEDVALRELKEETSIEAKIAKLAYKHIYDDNSEHHFYLCNYISGEPKLDDNSEEKTEMASGKEYYNPEWVDLSELSDLVVYPLEIRDWLIEDVKENFTRVRQPQEIKLSELRGWVKK